MKTLKNFNFKGKKVLVRCDFNVPLSKEGQVLDNFRIKQTIPTIKYLLEKEAKVILISHLGDPQKIKDKKEKIKNFSLKPIIASLKELLKKEIIFLDDCIGEKVEKEIEKIREGEVALLENLRFYKEEEAADEKFTKQLASLADVYVNDAFSVCHRSHASIVGVPKYLPSIAGFLLDKEVKILSKVLNSPWRPLVVIIGGVKISTKLTLISQFLKIADHLILGGEIANTILNAKGISVGKSFLEPEIVEKINELDLTSAKLHLPIDGVISLQDVKRGLEEGYLRTAGVGSVRSEEKAFDIGPETIKLFSEIIKGPHFSFWKGPLEYIKREKVPRTILWSGPLGFFENEKFERGTKEIAESIVSNHLAFKIIGGGDTISAVNKFGLLDKFDYVSTGGGAMLKFLSGEKMPGLEVLR